MIRQRRAGDNTPPGVTFMHRYSVFIKALSRFVRSKSALVTPCKPLSGTFCPTYCHILAAIGDNLAQGIEDLSIKFPVYGGITSGLDSFYAGGTGQQKVKDKAGWVEYVQKMDFIDYSDAASAGYKFGEGIADKISRAFSLDSIDAFNLGDTFEGIYNNTSETAANTAASADSLNLNNEELEWMRDLAEQEAINRFTTTEIRVDMGGVTQNVASYLDAETLTHRMVEAINNGAAMGVEGVYA